MKVGRNDPCSCGSGKKYKHCCARKQAQRAKLTDSLARGVFYLFAPLALILLAVVAIGALRGGDVGDDGLERVWSAAHGHWHAVLPDGSESEIKPGMVWDPDHGHFHPAQPPGEAVRTRVSSKLEQHLDDVADEAVE